MKYSTFYPNGSVKEQWDTEASTYKTFAADGTELSSRSFSSEENDIAAKMKAEEKALLTSTTRQQSIELALENLDNMIQQAETLKGEFQGPALRVANWDATLNAAVADRLVLLTEGLQTCMEYIRFLGQEALNR